MFNGLFTIFLLSVAVFGEKLVGIANYLLFDGNRDHIPLRQRQREVPDIIAADAHPDVALAYKSILRQSDAIQQLPSQKTMADIWMFSMAPKPRTIRMHNSNIMQQGSIVDKIQVRIQVRDLCGCSQSLLSNLSAPALRGPLGRSGRWETGTIDNLEL